MCLWPMLSMSLATSRTRSGVTSVLLTAWDLMTKVREHFRRNTSVLACVL